MIQCWMHLIDLSSFEKEEEYSCEALVVIQLIERNNEFQLVPIGSNTRNLKRSKIVFRIIIICYF